MLTPRSTCARGRSARPGARGGAGGGGGDGALGFWSAVRDVRPETTPTTRLVPQANEFDKLPKRLRPRARAARDHGCADQADAEKALGAFVAEFEAKCPTRPAWWRTRGAAGLLCLSGGALAASADIESGDRELLAERQGVPVLVDRGQLHLDGFALLGLRVEGPPVDVDHRRRDSGQPVDVGYRYRQRVFLEEVSLGPEECPQRDRVRLPAPVVVGRLDRDRVRRRDAGDAIGTDSDAGAAGGVETVSGARRDAASGSSSTRRPRARGGPRGSLRSAPPRSASRYRGSGRSAGSRRR